MATTPSTASTVDLRVALIDDVLERVQRSLQARFRPQTIVRKRRSVGAQTDRDTWVRIERRPSDRVGCQGWNGAECAAWLDGVAGPAWHGCVVWHDRPSEAMWRADEMELLPGRPVGKSVLTTDPNLPVEWWQSLNSSLNALAVHKTPRVATPDTVMIGQERITCAIRSTFAGPFDTSSHHWQPAHADLTWANMTAPQFCLFDWEDWGMAPRGLDAATLWANSLLVPALADRVWRERRDDLESGDGMLMTLFVCTKILGPHAYPDDPRQNAARQVTERVVAELQSV